jgi:phosphoglycolate phosphatase
MGIRRPTGGSVTLAELLARCPNILLDFDGPVCSVFTSLTSEEVSRRLYVRLHQAGAPLSDGSAPADPFDVLHRVKSVAPRFSDLAESALSELELEAVRTARPTIHVIELLQALADAERHVVIVSNNGVAAIEHFLAEHSLRAYVAGVAARISPNPDILKPHPHLLLSAASQLGVEPDSCVLLGDSVTDVQAAHRVGAGSIAFANRPRKRKPLCEAAPDVVVSDLSEVVAALKHVR